MDFPPDVWYNGLGLEKGAAYERQAQVPFLADPRRTGAAGRPVFPLSTPCGCDPAHAGVGGGHPRCQFSADRTGP